LIDFVVGADAQSWPRVAAGISNDEIRAATASGRCSKTTTTRGTLDVWEDS